VGKIQPRAPVWRTDTMQRKLLIALLIIAALALAALGAVLRPR
jgi:hypothetical protein